MPTKPWYESKTMWAGLITLLLNTYAALPGIFGLKLPEIPATVIAVIDALLGGLVLHGRVTATTKIA